MWPATRALLEEFYRPYNAFLARVLEGAGAGGSGGPSIWMWEDKRAKAKASQERGALRRAAARTGHGDTADFAIPTKCSFEDAGWVCCGEGERGIIFIGY